MPRESEDPRVIRTKRAGVVLGAVAVVGVAGAMAFAANSGSKVETRGTPSARREGAMRELRSAALRQGAIAVTADSGGHVHVLVEVGAEMRLPAVRPLARIVRTARKKKEFAAAERQITTALSRMGFSVGSFIDAATGRVVIETNAPPCVDRPLVRQYRGLVTIKQATIALQ